MSDHATAAPLFAALRNSVARNALGERNDCTVIATSIVTGVSYAEAHAALKHQGRRNGHGTHPVQYQLAIGLLSGDICKEFPTEARTVRKLAIELAKYPRTSRFLVVVRGHVLAFAEGRVQDWTRERLHHVRTVWEVRQPNALASVPVPTTTPTRTKGAVAHVWDVCNRLHDLHPLGEVTRKTVLNICAKRGINKHTAATQYQAWRNR